MKHVSDILQAAGIALGSSSLSSSSSHGIDDDNDKNAALGEREEAILMMEAWLGLSSDNMDDENNGTTAPPPPPLTVEDCLPLSHAVYAAAVDWLVQAWNGGDDSGSGLCLVSTPFQKNLNDHPLRTAAAAAAAAHEATASGSSTPSPPLLLLEASFDSVRATKWLRAWMEFNVSGDVSSGGGGAADDNNSLPQQYLYYSSLSRRLLLADVMEPITAGGGVIVVAAAAAAAVPEASDNSTTTTTSKSAAYNKVSTKNALLRALYKHVQDLPDLQQQVLAYSQCLQRADPHSMVAPNATTGLLLVGDQPRARLLQYERAMAASNRLQQEWQAHVDRLQWILGDFYAAADPDQRRVCRRLLGQVWSAFVLLQSSSSGSSSSSSSGSVRHENTTAAAVNMTLQVLRRILLGIRNDNNADDDAVMQHLLFHQLIPLHKADGVVLWRDQTAVLELYHEPLCQCIMAILLKNNFERRKELVLSVIQHLLQRTIFPSAGSTPKQVLLLHEIDTYLRLLLVPPEEAKKNDDAAAKTTAASSECPSQSYLKEERAMLQALFQTLARCMSSENSRVAERALQFFQNAPFEQLLTTQQRQEQHHGTNNLELALHVFLPALVRREPSWNPTVRKMTYNVLKQLRGYDEAVFEAVCNRTFLQDDLQQEVTLTGPEASASNIVASQTEEAAATRAMASPTTDFSLKAGMGNWRPPSSSSTAGMTREPGSMPPPTARRPSNSSSSSSSTGSTTTPGRGTAPWAKMPTVTPVAPPLTVTGVAPWAMKQPAALPALGHKRGAPEAPLKHISEESVKKAHDELPKTGLEYVFANMEKIKPPHEEEGVSSWSRAQMAETPTYLPSLKFHDLVFGHDLGSGAFASVKYARLIEKTKPRSQWAEYAVKVVSTEKIRALGYEASIQREIAVLRFLSHPGIARLVSSFRFHDGAYLVLEYASRGDLHTLLQKHGSLDLDSTRFVIGEVVAALASIHERGFLYGDLKPENIVITEPGHIKLTDYGGCRPITEEAKDLIKSVAKDILKNLRDGDWKVRPPSVTSSSGYDSTSSNDHMEEDSVGLPAGDDADADEEEEDVRIEGTIAYLPPEVVMGAFPTIAADAWALGCVTYQCLSGRPPLLEADDDATRNRIVSFDFNVNASKSEIDRLFEDKHAAGITPEARDMIKSLLDRDPSKRPGMNQLAEHAFFTSNVFALYSQPAYPLDVGNVAPAPNAQWARRQFSSIWAPQPAVYSLSLPNDSLNGSAGPRPSADAPIPEGEEAPGFFSASGKLPSTETAPVVNRRTGRMLLPPSY